MHGITDADSRCVAEALALESYVSYPSHNRLFLDFYFIFFAF